MDLPYLKCTLKGSGSSVMKAKLKEREKALNDFVLLEEIKTIKNSFFFSFFFPPKSHIGNAGGNVLK